MKILADKRIKQFFVRAGLLTLIFTLLSAVLAGLAAGVPGAQEAAGPGEGAALWAGACCLGLGLSILMTAFLHFREENRILEEAVAQIRAYLQGDPDARIDCEEEGELYRLFHEINSLAAILNAHAENEAKSREFMKDTIADISHQLKTPLAALNIYNGILQGEAENLPEIREFTDLSEQELDRIETLVQNLLKIAKLDAGTIVMEKAEESVPEMMWALEKQFACRAELEDKTLTFSGEDGVTLNCDRSWFLEAAGNLVKNAFDHTEKGGAIRVEWRQFASVVQITVKDDGRGIHPEDLHHIFKRFYRSRFSKGTKGIGLGLPLAKAVVEMHGGTIEADSEPGKGAVFTMNFLSESP